MSRYITNGVLIGLHYHKAGQNNSRKKVSAIMLAIFCLVVMPLAIYNREDSGRKSTGQSWRVGSPPPAHARAVDLPLSSVSNTTKFPIGYVGKIRIVSRSGGPEFSLHRLPEPSLCHLAVPGVSDSLATGDSDFPLSTDYEYGLNDPDPMWKFTSRGLPVGYRKEAVSLPNGFMPPKIVFVNPRWPSGVRSLSDTVKVDGLLTCLSNGRLSISSVHESHRELGFAESVKDAIRQGHCDPALDAAGQPISVQYRYCCLFVQGAIPSVSVGSSINAKIKED